MSFEVDMCLECVQPQVIFIPLEEFNEFAFLADISRRERRELNIERTATWKKHLPRPTDILRYQTRKR